MNSQFPQELLCVSSLFTIATSNTITNVSTPFLPNANNSLFSFTDLSLSISGLSELLKINIENTDRKLRAQRFNLINKSVNCNSLIDIPYSFNKLFHPIQYEFKSCNHEFHLI